eukprot:UN08911
MKNSAVALLHLRKCFKEDLGVLFCEDHLVSAKVKRLSKMLKGIAVRLLQERECNIVGLQERVRLLVQLVTEVLDTPFISMILMSLLMSLLMSRLIS